MLEKLLKKIIEAQKGKKDLLTGQVYYPVDISLVNGNIMLRAFRIHSINGNEIKGLTWKEEYSAPRENRKEIYCFINIEDIASLSCYDLGIDYHSDLT